MEASPTSNTPAEATAWPDDPAGLMELAAQISEGTSVPPSGGPPDALYRERARVLEGPPEELLAQIDRILVAPQAADGIRFLSQISALEVLLPEVSALVDFHQSCPVHHKDLWAHTLEVLQRTPAVADLRWVALLHDVGKVSTRALDGSGSVSFLRHEQVGALLARGVGARLGMTPERTDRIAFVIGHHGRLNAYETSWSDRAVRRLIRDGGELLDDLMAFSGADFTTRRPGRRRKIEGRLSDLRSRIEKLLQAESNQELPRGLGRALMEGLELGPGPELGGIISWLQAEICSGRLSQDAPLEIFVETAKGYRSQQE
ncbi:MAG: HD domain-containing protein [Myxococcota bacterium]|nr:HD domain-containing protein [Myxococcota bacterium]